MNCTLSVNGPSAECCRSSSFTTFTELCEYFDWHEFHESRASYSIWTIIFKCVLSFWRSLHCSLVRVILFSLVIFSTNSINYLQDKYGNSRQKITIEKYKIFIFWKLAVINVKVLMIQCSESQCFGLKLELYKGWKEYIHILQVFLFSLKIFSDLSNLNKGY